MSTRKGLGFKSKSPADMRRFAWGIGLLTAALVIAPMSVVAAADGNDTASSATGVKGGRNGPYSIQPASDSDWYAFRLTQQRHVTIETSGPQGDTTLALYKNGTKLTEDDDGGEGYWSRIQRVLSPGRYHVVVRAFAGGEAIPTYYLSVSAQTSNRNPPPQPTPSGPGAEGDTTRAGKFLGTQHQQPALLDGVETRLTLYREETPGTCSRGAARYTLLLENSRGSEYNKMPLVVFAYPDDRGFVTNIRNGWLDDPARRNGVYNESPLVSGTLAMVVGAVIDRAFLPGTMTFAELSQNWVERAGRANYPSEFRQPNFERVFDSLDIRVRSVDPGNPNDPVNAAFLDFDVRCENSSGFNLTVLVQEGRNVGWTILRIT